MPRNVRNFWIEVETLDVNGGRKVATGPRSSSGGADIIIRQRNHGEVDPLTIEVKCRCDDDGNLLVDIYKHGNHIGSKITTR